MKPCRTYIIPEHVRGEVVPMSAVQVHGYFAHFKHNIMSKMQIFIVTAEHAVCRHYLMIVATAATCGQHIEWFVSFQCSFVILC